MFFYKKAVENLLGQSKNQMKSIFKKYSKAKSRTYNHAIYVPGDPFSANSFTFTQERSSLVASEVRRFLRYKKNYRKNNLNSDIAF